MNTIICKQLICDMIYHQIDTPMNPNNKERLCVVCPPYNSGLL